MKNLFTTILGLTFLFSDAFNPVTAQDNPNGVKNTATRDTKFTKSAGGLRTAHVRASQSSAAKPERPASIGQEKILEQSHVAISPLAYTDDPPKGMVLRELMRHERYASKGVPLNNRLLSIALLGNVPEGTGHSLRASLWNAASVAGLITEDPLFDRSFILKLNGRSDGPSAGGLYTIAILALLRGDELKPDVTMTGTILPDGSLGGVGGIRYKMEGAKKAGIRKVVLPEYLRVEIDRDTGHVVDLAEHGKKLGLEVVFVSNVQEAYPHFTGKNLGTPQSPVVSSGKQTIKLPAALEHTLKVRAKDRFKELMQVTKEIDAGVRPYDAKFDDEADKNAVSKIAIEERGKVYEATGRAAKLMEAGRWIAAFEEINAAWISGKSLLRWQELGFRLPEEDAVEEYHENYMHKIFEHRDLLTGGCTDNPVEKGILDVRAFHDGLNIYAKLMVNGDFSNSIDFQIQQFKGEREIMGRKHDPARIRSKKLELRALQALRVHKMISILDNTSPPAEKDELELDLLSGAFTLRGANEDSPRALDPEKVMKWLLFNRTRNQVLLGNLKSTLEYAQEDLRTDFDTRKAVALIAYDNEYERDKESTPFGEAVLLTKQGIELSFVAIKNDLYGYNTAALQSILNNARTNARDTILKTSKLNYQMYGPRYDYLRAEGLQLGDTEHQLQALRLYMSAAAVCRLLESCVVDVD